MSTTLLSAISAALLSATCLTALADSSTQQYRINTVSEPAADSASGYIQVVERNGSHSMHANAPLAGQLAADDPSGFIQAVERNGSHSMHPNAPVAAEQFADDNAKALQQTGDQWPQAPRSN